MMLPERKTIESVPHLPQEKTRTTSESLSKDRHPRPISHLLLRSSLRLDPKPLHMRLLRLRLQLRVVLKNLVLLHVGLIHGTEDVLLKKRRREQMLLEDSTK